MPEMKGSERSLQGSTSADWICDSCVHGPPSSFDGKPCALCNPDDPMLNCYQKREEPVTTNADRIRAMSDEELVEAFLSGCDGRECPTYDYPLDPYPKDTILEQCRQCWLNWLQSPAGGDGDG